MLLQKGDRTSQGRVPCAMAMVVQVHHLHGTPAIQHGKEAACELSTWQPSALAMGHPRSACVPTASLSLVGAVCLPSLTNSRAALNWAPIPGTLMPGVQLCRLGCLCCGCGPVACCNPLLKVETPEVQHCKQGGICMHVVCLGVINRGPENAPC
jgi:hypothetical protein